MFRRKPKTTFDQLPKEAQRLILHFNAEWNMQRITEGWAILCWEKHKDLYHREGGVTLYMLHLLKQMIDGKIRFHKDPYYQMKWFNDTWVNFAPRCQITLENFAKTTQFPSFLLPLIDKWLTTLIFEKNFHPDWEQLAPYNIYQNSLTDSGLQPHLIHELRSHRVLYLLWGSMWCGKTNYGDILVLLNQFLYIIAPKFQNPQLVQNVLDELMIQDLEAIKSGFLEHLKSCY